MHCGVPVPCNLFYFSVPCIACMGLPSFAPPLPLHFGKAMPTITPTLSEELGEWNAMAHSGTPSTSCGVCQPLWNDEEVQASVMKSLQHPFVRALAAGSLPRWVPLPPVSARLAGGGAAPACCLPRPPCSTPHSDRWGLGHVWGAWRAAPCCLG